MSKGSWIKVVETSIIFQIFFLNLKIINLLARTTKTKDIKSQVIKIRNEMRNITTNFRRIKRIVRK